MNETKQSEIERIQYPQIDGLHIFFDTVTYRTPHVHPELELIWVVEGGLSVSTEKRRYEAKLGTPVVFNPNQSHEFHSMGERCTFLCLQLSLEQFTRVYPELQHLSLDSVFPDDYLSPEERKTLRGYLLSLARAYFREEPHYALWCTGQAALLLHLLFSRMPAHTVTKGEISQRQRRGDLLKRLLDYVDENYTHKLRLEDFARAQGRSVGFLSHFFKENTGQTFQEYVNTVRFNAACKRIAAGEERMLDVCMESGFSDYRYFSRTFQRRTGMTPEEYRKSSSFAVPETIHVHRSIHSLERFYSRETCLRLLKRLEETGEISTKEELPSSV